MLELFFLFIFFLSLGLTYLVKRIAIKRQLLDIPNERSSHSQPTPSGGGLAIVISFYIAIAYFYDHEIIEINEL